MACTKQNYVDRVMAELSARKLMKKLGWRLFAYKCRRCPYWHLTRRRPSNEEPDRVQW